MDIMPMDEERLTDLLAQFRSKAILVLGDVMLDRFIWGSVSRISPEAPVPVVRVQRESAYPGGAANVARNLLPFAGNVSVMGVIGPGKTGDLLVENFKEEGMATGDLFRDDDYETIVKTRVVAQSQQVVRIDWEKPHPVAKAVRAQVLQRLEEKLPGLDAIIMADYGKGLLGQELVDAVVERAAARKVPVTVDPNPNNPILWRGVAAVKPNRLEAFQAAGMQVQPLGDDLVTDPLLLEMARRLHERWRCEHLVITLGHRGLIVMSRGEAPWHSPPHAQEVFDVSGAGDTAMALFTLSLCAKASAREAAHWSNHAAGIVVGKVGTATTTPEELLTRIKGASGRGHPSQMD